MRVLEFIQTACQLVVSGCAVILLGVLALVFLFLLLAVLGVFS